MTLIRFTEDCYLPFVEDHKRISTFRGYRNIWRRYLKPRCDIKLREFRTVEGERILGSIVRGHNLTSTTLAHIKAFLSGIFRFAKTSRCDQFRESGRGRGPAQRQTCRRKPRLFTQKDHADAKSASGTGLDDRGCRGIHGCLQRRTPRVPLERITTEGRY